MWSTAEHGPGHGDHGDHGDHGRRRTRRHPATSTTLDALIQEIADYLEAGLGHGDCFMVFDVERPEPCANRFVQIAFDGADVHAEASAMVCVPWECDGRHALSAAQQARLRALGWHPPAGDPDAGKPNWHRSFRSMHGNLVPLVAELLARTLVDVMGLREGDELTITIDRLDRPDRRCPWAARPGRLYCRR